MARLAAGLLAAAALWLLPAAGPARAEDLIRVGNPSPLAFDFVPQDVAQATGILKKHGLTLEKMAFASGARMHQALAAGSIDIALGSGPDMGFVAKGAPEMAVAAFADAPSFVTLAVRKDITALSQLKGKKVSVSSVGSLTNWLAHQISIQQGWGPNGIEVVPLGANTAQVAALKLGQVDGSVFDVRVAIELERDGFVRRLVDFADIVPNYHAHVIFASDEMIRNRPEVLRRFLAAWFEAVKFMKANKGETVKIAAPIMNANDETVTQIYDYLMPTYSVTGRFKPAALEVLNKSFVEMGQIDKPADLGKIYTEAYLPDAAK
jgi:ABC-type nitrate/sulfonate/bicarbonate transport system substrate-binding protein